jgi:hypothetical protein
LKFVRRGCGLHVGQLIAALSCPGQVLGLRAILLPHFFRTLAAPRSEVAVVPLAENRHRAPRCQGGRLAKPSGEAPGAVRLHSEYLELSPRIICTPPGRGPTDARLRRVKVRGSICCKFVDGRLNDFGHVAIYRRSRSGPKAAIAGYRWEADGSE